MAMAHTGKSATSWRIFIVVLMVLQVTLSAAVSACGLPKPHGRVILTISGKIGECNGGHELRLDLEMLEALPSNVIKSNNPWDRGEVTYKGVLLRDLMRYAKAQGEIASVEALNDYRANISLREMKQHDVILAYRRDGSTIPVRDRGPLFVVFPLLGKYESMRDVRYGQSVWQVHRIELR